MKVRVKGKIGSGYHMASRFEYVNINDYCFCLQQNPAVLAWILFFRRDELLTIKPWLKKNRQEWKTGYYWDRFKSNLLTLIRFMQCRLNFRDAELVELPVYGQLDVPVHKGHKIFNLYNGTVTKIFDPDVNILSVIREIDHLRRISQIDFAPSLRKWNFEERWYKEDYMRGAIASSHRSTDSGTFLKAFSSEAAPCIKRLISFQHPLTKYLPAYIEELRAGLDLSGTMREKSCTEEIDIFGNFVNLVIERLKDERDLPVHLVFTHGDFCPANILDTKHGIRIVDWESAGPRSLLFDFYSYFFYRPVNLKNISVDKMFSELDRALPAFISGTDFEALGVPECLSGSINTYRLLFYIEHLCRLVDRLRTDKRLNIMDYIMRYIDAFSLYEQKCAKVAKSGQTRSVIDSNALMDIG